MSKLASEQENEMALPSRKWPESQKDKDIKVIMVEKAK